MFFVINNALAILCAWSIGQLACNHRDPLRRLLVAMVGYGAVVIISTQMLGAIGLLVNPAVTGVLAVLTGSLLGLVTRERRQEGRSGRIEVHDTYRGSVDPSQRLLPLMAATLLTGIVGAIALRALLFGTEFVWDDLTYHASSVGHWIRASGFTETPWNAQAYYPMNAELVSFWFVFPFRSDAYASAAGLYWLLLLVTSILYVCRRLQIRWTEALMAASLSAAAFKAYVLSFSAVDLAGYAALLAAVALSMPDPTRSDVALSGPDALVSGAAAGIAAGTKLFAGPGVGIVLLWWLTASHVQPIRTRVRLSVWFALGSVALGSFWYSRTFLLTGNPFFPAAVGPFSGWAALYEDVTLFNAIAAHAFDKALYSRIAKDLAALGVGPIIVAALGYASAVARLARRRSSIEIDARRNVILLLVLGLTYAGMFPWLPFSGYYYDGAFHLSSRYVAALVVPIGLALFFWGIEPDSAAHRLRVVLAVLALMVTWRFRPADAGLALLLGGSVLLIAGRPAISATCLAVLRRFPVWVTAVTLVLVFLFAWLPIKQRLTDESLMRFDQAPWLNDSWRALEAQAREGDRITWFGNKAHLYYPLFGRDFRLEPIRTRSDGTVSKPFFTEFHEVPLESIYADRLEVDQSTYVTNLVVADIDYVLVSSQPRSSSSAEAWRARVTALETSPQARLTYSDGEVSIWKIEKR